ncbi:hypothetical protein JL09_g6988, partial [Pichia kudriavzevii]
KKYNPYKTEIDPY